MESPVIRGWKALERRFKKQAISDDCIYLPNSEPEVPVDHLFIAMEPSLGRWARGRTDVDRIRNAHQKIGQGFRNFLYSFEDFLLHFCDSQISVCFWKQLPPNRRFEGSYDCIGGSDRKRRTISEVATIVEGRDRACIPFGLESLDDWSCAFRFSTEARIANPTLASCTILHRPREVGSWQSWDERTSSQSSNDDPGATKYSRPRKLSS